MRPLELEVMGFGPYATRQIVPFDKLDPIFLVGGDTGAGKTTLFDAISYALYGVPLGTRSSDQVRSNLVSADTSTYVRFRFTCGGATWEVLRSPYTVRPAKRGGGIVTEEITTLHQVLPGGAMSPVAGRPSELNKKLANEILKLSHDHFSKILVLPQGEFQRFLEMESSQRAVILEKLFPIEEHRALKTRADDAVRGIRAAVLDKQAALAEVRRALVPDGDVPNLEAHLDTRDAALLDQERLAADAERVAAEAARAAQTRLEAGAQLADQLAALDTAQQAWAAVSALAPAVDATRAALDASRRASLARLPIDAATKLDRQITDTSRALDTLNATEAEVAARHAQSRVASEALPGREAALRVADDALVVLDARVRDLASLVKAGQATVSADLAVDRADAAVGPAAVAVREAEAALAALAGPTAERVTRAEALRLVTERAASLGAQRQDADRVEKWDGRYAQELQRRRDDAAPVTVKLAADEGRARDALELARARREAQAAVMLAASLVEGEPCPVCGGADHPSPAHGQVGDEDLRASVVNAEAALSSAQAASTAHAAMLAEMEGKAGVLREVADESRARLSQAGFSDVTAWRTAVHAAEAAQQAAQAQVDTLDALLRTRPAREAAADKARARKTEVEAALAAARVAAATARAAMDGLVARVGQVQNAQAEQAQALASLTAGRAAAEAERQLISRVRAEHASLEASLAAAVSAVRTTRGTLTGLQEAAVVAADAVRDALVTQRFATVDEALAAARAPQDEAALRQEVEGWERRKTELDTRIGELTQSIAGRTLPDLEALRLSAQDLSVAAQGATAARVGLARDLSDLRALRARHQAVERELDLLTSDSAGLLQLAKDLGGDNAKRVDFPTYVLMWWLHQVLARATTRLQLLSEGRYRFALRSDTADRRARGGLDVDVFDAYSADRRDVKTLSGGEKFMASLSLALGLADVIQERAGGIELDTLFIDEGFGSLDPSAMDRALQVIDEIGAHRRVGVISHVESVKKAIPCHVLVEKSPTGSTVRIG